MVLENILDGQAVLDSPEASTAKPVLTEKRVVTIFSDQVLFA
jgi:hypothetical protein